MLYNICNMCGQDLPDMSTLTLGCCMALGSCIHIRQIPSAHVTYITCCFVRERIKEKISTIYAIENQVYCMESTVQWLVNNCLGTCSTHIQAPILTHIQAPILTTHAQC